MTVTELSRWGRSTQDLVQTLDDLHGWKVSVLAQTGLSFDLSTSSGKLMRTIMAGLAEFERDLIRERVKSGLAAARARGAKLGRQHGPAPIRQESQARVGDARGRPVLPADRPQRRAFQEHRHGNRKAGGGVGGKLECQANTGSRRSKPLTPTPQGASLLTIHLSQLGKTYRVRSVRLSSAYLRPGNGVASTNLRRGRTINRRRAPARHLFAGRGSKGSGGRAIPRVSSGLDTPAVGHDTEPDRRPIGGPSAAIGRSRVRA